MTEGVAERMTVELTMAEAKLIVAALRQFEPYWPSDMDDISRADLLEELRGKVVTLVDTFGPNAPD